MRKLIKLLLLLICFASCNANADVVESQHAELLNSVIEITPGVEGGILDHPPVPLRSQNRADEDDEMVKKSRHPERSEGSPAS